MTRNDSEDPHTRRVAAPDECKKCGDLENPPEGWDEGLKELVWNLREWGYPITKRSMDYLIDYLEKVDAKPEEVNYQVAAQSISQNTDLEFETNNTVCDRHYLESQGVDTEELSDVGVQLVLEDFRSGDHV